MAKLTQQDPWGHTTHEPSCPIVPVEECRVKSHMDVVKCVQGQHEGKYFPLWGLCRKGRMRMSVFQMYAKWPFHPPHSLQMVCPPMWSE